MKTVTRQEANHDYYLRNRTPHKMNTCSVCGCDIRAPKLRCAECNAKFVVAKNHEYYERKKEAKKLQIVATEKPCRNPTCNEIVPAGNMRYHSDECRARAKADKARVKYHGGNDTIATMRKCSICGTEFTPDKRHPDQRFCGRVCGKKNWLDSEKTRRAELREAAITEQPEQIEQPEVETYGSRPHWQARILARRTNDGTCRYGIPARPSWAVTA